MWYDSLNVFSLLVLVQGMCVVNNIIGETTPELPIPGVWRGIDCFQDS